MAGKLNNELIKIFEETRKISKREFFADTQCLVDFDTKVYMGDLMYYTVVKPNPTPIKVIAGGTVETGYRLSKEGRTAILNFADAVTAGGLVLAGGTTQEENICRCSNLYESLIRDECMEKYYIPNRENAKTTNHLYTNNVIYSRDVVIFRDDETYKFIEPKHVDVITCPAPYAIIPDDMAYSLYLTRIEQIVLSAKVNDARKLVLGAWGCGAFLQKPELVSKAFAVVLNEYGDLFDEIVFAIRPTPDGTGTGNGTMNIFTKTLKENYRGEVTNG